MELSTKKLFTSQKKLKISLNKRSKLSTKKLVYITKSNQSSSEKKENSNKNSNKKIITASNNKINPFNQDFIRNNTQTNLPSRKITSSKEQNIYLKFLKHDINEARHNIEHDANDANENVLNTNIDEKNKNKNDVDIDMLVNLFKYKSSKLKSTIIMDNNGNNNLDSEQKKLIMDCFDKKIQMENNVKNCKIYKSNNQKNKKKNFIRSDRTKRFKTRQISFFEKQNFKFNNLFKLEERKNNEDFNINKSHDEKENNSIFENCTNKSLDSSFLGSSLAEDEFIQDINNNMQTIN